MSARFSLSTEMSRLPRNGAAEPISRDPILRREQRGQVNIHFSCSADHEQDWQPYPVDPYSYSTCDHTYIQYFEKQLYYILASSVFLQPKQSTTPYTNKNYL